MYRLFSSNLQNYLQINSCGEYKDERITIAGPLKGMADIKLYNEWKKNRDERFEEVCNLVFEINENKNEIHSFELFSYELWGYGYDAVKSFKFSQERISQQLKLIDLLLGTHYWI